MRNLTLRNIASAVEGQLFAYTENGFVAVADGDVTVSEDEATCVVIDSRKLEEGGIFIATVGERVDGHDFIEKVSASGALGAVCEHLPEIHDGRCCTCIVVKDSFEALRKLATYYRDVMSDVKIVGIVGSVGKTSTKEFVASVLTQKFSVLKTEGNFNNEVGVPLTLLRIRDSHEMAVVEMGINKFGEMDRLGLMVRPDGVVFTNVGPCHLEFLDDLDGVLRAKSEVFGHIRRGGFICLNSEDAKLCTVKEVPGIELLHYGENSDSSAKDRASKGLLGTDFTLSLKAADRNSEFAVSVPLPGSHMVMNALAAALVGARFGMNDESIARGIASTEAVGGRSHLIRTDRYILVDDCYNANPKSMESAIELLGESEGRRVAILGDMFELGENEEELHEGVGRFAGLHGVDMLVCIGKLSANMAAGYKKEASRDALYYPDVDAFLDDIASVPFEKSDTILIKASHGMCFTRIVETLSKA